MKLNVVINQINAQLLLSPDVYDNEGNVIGDMPRDAFEREMEWRRGKVSYRATFTCDGKRMSIQSHIVEPKERRSALRSMMGMLADNLDKHWDSFNPSAQFGPPHPAA